MVSPTYSATVLKALGRAPGADDQSELALGRVIDQTHALDRDGVPVEQPNGDEVEGRAVGLPTPDEGVALQSALNSHQFDGQAVFLEQALVNSNEDGQVLQDRQSHVLESQGLGLAARRHAGRDQAHEQNA
jgi:hypothetical protein